MNPGRELDALIAEKVMGISIDHVRACFNHSGTYESDTPFLIKNYSTDIESAWEIIKEIPMTVYSPRASFANGEYANGGSPSKDNKDEWSAEARLKESDYYDSHREYGETAPHAICLAALKAKGVEV